VTTTAPVGLLVMRAWVEEDSQHPLRVEARLTTDVARGFERELTVSGPAAARELVGSWLADVLARAASGTATGHATVT
jgi:hypothetical protein